MVPARTSPIILNFGCKHFKLSEINSGSHKAPVNVVDIAVTTVNTHLATIYHKTLHPLKLSTKINPTANPAHDLKRCNRVEMVNVIKPESVHMTAPMRASKIPQSLC